MSASDSTRTVQFDNRSTATWARRRLATNPRTWGYGLVLSGIVIAVSAATRQRGSVHAEDSVLVGTVAGLVLPILTFGIVSAAFDGKGARDAVGFTARFGGEPGGTYVPFVGYATAASAIVSAGLALVAMFVSNRFHVAVADAAETACVMALGGATYTVLYAWASTFGPAGEGRVVVLLIDWFVGAGSGAMSLITPRAHLRGLLGERTPLDTPPRLSCVFLVVMFLLFAFAGLRRAWSIRAR
ncbi:MAG: hypothetical protein U0169_12155 [Polyangiaceae bacterium]